MRSRPRPAFLLPRAQVAVTLGLAPQSPAALEPDPRIPNPEAPIVPILSA